MKTKWEYYKENRYYVHNIVIVIIAGFFFGSWYKNGLNAATLLGIFLCVGAIVVTIFQVNASYRRYADQEREKTNWTQTRTDMINTEEDD